MAILPPPTPFNRIRLAASLMTVLIPGAVSQPAGFNYDESAVPAYALPDPLVNLVGDPVNTAEQWTGQRRSEVLGLFAEHVYGHTPPGAVDVHHELTESNDHVFDGRARRQQVRLHFRANGHEIAADLLIYLPRTATGPVPLFLGLNFFGNHTITTDPEVHLNQNWMRSNPEIGVVDHRATADSRGAYARRWPVELILQRGYGLATLYSGDIDPDVDDGFQNGVHPLFYANGQTQPAANEWGTLAAWAWGLSRSLDYLETDNTIDASRVAVLGHSRLGKAALWAGARDERFALVISNNSGCGGAALSRRRFGETIERINTSFPHWFCGGHQRYNGREDDLPIDQHMLLALMAPRPVYVASAVEDLWADPRGEFLAARHAEPVYALLGRSGLGIENFPPVNQPVGDTIGYHVRTGKHDVTIYDWQRYLDFADRHFTARN